MIFGYFVLAVAVLISAVSAYYSVLGLTAIFTGSFWPIVIMGSVLEIGKIASAVWLHKNWHRASIQYKLYLVPAVIVIMLITSMGIFGGLSKAYLAQNVPIIETENKIKVIDNSISVYTENINSAKSTLAQLDASVNGMVSRTTDSKGIRNSERIRKNQKAERDELNKIIALNQKNIDVLISEKQPMVNQLNTIESEVGAIKYIAALIYGDQSDSSTIDKAVRTVILLIVGVFDPLAIVLILGATKHLYWVREEKKEGLQTVASVLDSESKESVNPLEQHNDASDESPIVNNYGDFVSPRSDWVYTTTVNDENDEKVNAESSEINKLQKKIETLTQTIANVESARNTEQARVIELQQKIDELTSQQESSRNSEIIHLENELLRANALVKSKTDEINSLGEVIQTIQPKQVATFGNEFPINPSKGDLFLRTDYNPPRLYKWNDVKWMELSRDYTDSYLDNLDYVKLLMERVNNGQIDVETLTQDEQDAIYEMMKDNERV